MSVSIVSLGGDRHDARNRTILKRASEALSQQAEVLAELAKRLDLQFCRAIDLILDCRGRVVVCGIGKSGLIGRKLAATLSSSGTPSYFLHPSEAFHGDLGMIAPGDVLLLISNSGRTEELVALLPSFRQLKLPTIALVGDVHSPVARAADAVLDISVDREICPYNLMPTTSTLATLVLGDALAVAAMRERDFSPSDFARLHPRGALGRRLSHRVADVMKTRSLPLVEPDVTVHQALLTMSSGRCGLVVIVDDRLTPLGIITDGDLRRALQSGKNILDLNVTSIMTSPPVTVRSDATAHDAKERMHRLRIKALVVVDANNRVEGVVDVFDG